MGALPGGDDVVQLAMNGVVFEDVKTFLEARGLTVIPFKVTDDPAEVPLYVVGISPALWAQAERRDLGL